MDQYLEKKLDGRYEILELVGIGGMANVYKARDCLEGTIVAVKILREEFAGSEEFLRRFKNESKAIAVLSHPNIVRVLDVNFTSKVNYIVMEYIDGITLKEYIDQEKVLSWKEAVYFTVQILRGLQHAHDKGIVHRDIKPQNIMLLADGTIKIMDFGIARFARSEIKTLTDKAIGSVHYISPEQAQGGATDQRADIYSVGVMLFEMLTGQLPFEADTAVSVAIKQIQSTPRTPRSINPSIPEGLEDITMRAMQKDASKRYQSAAAMLRDIDEFKRNPSIHFEYQYLSGPEPMDTKGYQDAKMKHHTEETGSKKRKKHRREKEEEKRLPVLPILAGITAAFVVAAMGFIFLMVYLNNPFAKVEEVPLPNLVGLEYDLVKSSDEYKDFNITIVEHDYSEEYEEGVIYDQNPTSGKNAKVGSTIEVKVSDGIRQVPMPNVIGQTESDACNTLTQAGLSYETVEMNHESVPAGRVIATQPEADQVIPYGSTVTVTVSLGAQAKDTEVPDVRDLDLEEARAELEAAGLNVGNISYTMDEDIDEGTVIAQDPQEGSMIEEGGLVNLQVSSGDREIRSIQLYVMLPSTIDETVTVTAYQDGTAVHAETFTPSDVRIWKPSFDGEGTSQVQIYIESQLYQEYTLDFDSGTHSLTADYSAGFELEGASGEEA